MKINLTAVLLFAGGFVLIYGAVKNRNPKDVVVAAFSGENPADLPAWGGAPPSGLSEEDKGFNVPGIPGAPRDDPRQGVPGRPGIPGAPIIPPRGTTPDDRGQVSI